LEQTKRALYDHKYTWKVNTQDIIRKIKDQLYLRLALPLKPRVKQPSPIADIGAADIAAADIALLKARSFLCGIKRKGVVIGSTSLYEIERLIEDRKGQDALPNNKEELCWLVYEKLL